ncbi:MAG: cupin domain-containing protein [Gemmatimonadetes bacterium]|nr:cupin domain-containing protein [Gemmatimonadota bacterium]
MAGVPWSERVVFDEGRAAKADLWKGERLFAGLNCFLPGQSQHVHSHAGADKFYLVLRGEGTFEVGGETFLASAGELVAAPAGVPHGVRNEGPGSLVVLTVIAPPPSAK